MKNYITVDGGTTNTRISLVCDGEVKNTLKLSCGARSSGDDKEQYKAALKEKIDAVRENSEGEIECILASGMITSELGIYPLEHLTVPVGIKELKEGSARVNLPEISDIPFVFVRGVKTACDSLENADMMRGEEAELMGIVSEKDGECLYMLMGSHTKIIETDKEGRIVGFCTMLTGELTESVANNTILKNSVSFENTELIPEYLKKGYEYCKKSGINEALFKVRILKNIFGATDSEIYSFFMGVILCGDIEYVLRKKTKKVVVGGNKNLREAISTLLEECYDGETVSLSDKAVEDSVSTGLVKIYEKEV